MWRGSAARGGVNHGDSRGAIWPSSPDSYNLRQVGIVPWRKAIIVNNRIRSE